MENRIILYYSGIQSIDEFTLFSKTIHRSNESGFFYTITILNLSLCYLIFKSLHRVYQNGYEKGLMLITMRATNALILHVNIVQMLEDLLETSLEVLIIDGKQARHSILSGKEYKDKEITFQVRETLFFLFLHLKIGMVTLQ